MQPWDQDHQGLAWRVGYRAMQRDARKGSAQRQQPVRNGPRADERHVTSAHHGGDRCFQHIGMIDEKASRTW